MLVAGCDPAHPGADASVDAGPPRLEVGTGDDLFVPFEDGATIALVNGPQGGQHLAVSLRVYGIDPRGTILDLRLTRDRDGRQMSQTFAVRVSLERTSAGHAEVWGLTLIVPEPDQAVGEPLTLRVRVTERPESGGRELEVERHLFIEWLFDDP